MSPSLPDATFANSTIRRAAVNGAVVCASLVVGLGLAELAIRVGAPQQLILLRPDIWQPLDTLGWAHRPEIDVPVNTGERTVRMITDEEGFRVGAGGRPEGDVRILLLGDSFMAAMQVEHEQSLAGLIEEEALGGLGATAAVWNTGVGAWDPPHYLIQARRALREGQFDVVLVSVFLGNDIVWERSDYFPPRQPVRRATFRVPGGFDPSELIDAWLAPVNDALEPRSHLFVFMKARLQGLLMRLGLTAVHIPSELQRAQAGSERWETTASILSEIACLARAEGVPSLFVLIPAVQQVDEELLFRHARSFGVDPDALDADQPDRLLLRETASRELNAVSATESLRTALDRGIEPYGRIDSHLSPDGHRVVWEVVKQPLKDLLREPRLSAMGDGQQRCAAPGPS